VGVAEFVGRDALGGAGCSAGGPEPTTYYVHGEMRSGRPGAGRGHQLYHPATLSGDVLRLHYARAPEVWSYFDLIAAQGEVYVQFWLKPGDPPAELRLADDRPEDPIPELLKGHLMD
jgi:inner membrane protein